MPAILAISFSETSSILKNLFTKRAISVDS